MRTQTSKRGKAGPNARTIIEFKDVQRSLNDIWPSIAPLLEVETKNPAGRRAIYTDQAIFAALLCAYFTGRSLRERLPNRNGPAPGSVFLKLDQWWPKENPTLPAAWAAYMRLIRKDELLAWRARLLGFDGPVEQIKSPPRYTNTGPPPALLRILVEVCEERLGKFCKKT